MKTEKKGVSVSSVFLFNFFPSSLYSSIHYARTLSLIICQITLRNKEPSWSVLRARKRFEIETTSRGLEDVPSHLITIHLNDGVVDFDLRRHGSWYCEQVAPRCTDLKISVLELTLNFPIIGKPLYKNTSFAFLYVSQVKFRVFQ